MEGFEEGRGGRVGRDGRDPRDLKRENRVVLSNGVRAVLGRGRRVLELNDDCDVTEDGSVDDGEGEDGAEVESAAGESNGVCSVDSLLERRTEVL